APPACAGEPVDIEPRYPREGDCLLVRRCPLLAPVGPGRAPDAVDSQGSSVSTSGVGAHRAGRCDMAKRTIEVFTAGCVGSEEAVAAVKAAACPSCDVQVRPMGDPAVVADARRYGIRSLPAVVINGQLADCCKGGGIDLDTLRGLGLGQP